jgi:glucokinase
MRVAGAIDIGGTRTKLGIVAEDGRVLERLAIATTKDGDPNPLVSAISAAITPLLRSAALRWSLERTIGVSVAGFLDASHSAMYGNANLPLLCDFKLQQALEERLDRTCLLEVDSNASALAEFRYGAGLDSTRFLGVTVGTGVGAGVIIDGELLRYTGECAGDLGHVIVAANGRRCTCGAHGCLEAMVCSSALVERGGGQHVRAIVESAQKGDVKAIRAIEETGQWLGLGLASLSPLFAPDTIVVGGGVGAAGDRLLDATRASYRDHAATEHRDRVRILGSSFQGWDGIIGAASVVLSPMKPRHMVSNPG